MNDDVLMIGLNALENASQLPVSREDVIEILKSGDGPGNLVRALFEDCSFEALDRMASTIGLSREQIRKSYEVARRQHGVANPDFDFGEP